MLITSKAAIRAFFWSVLAAAYIGALLTQLPEVYDEGLIVAGAVRILHGQLPYRDFITGYPPAQFYTIAGVFSVFGTTLLAERVWDTAWRLAIVGLAILIARAATQRKPAHPLPLICAGLVTGALGSRLYPMITGMLPCLAAVWCAVLYLNQRGVRWLFFSGIAAGAAILYRHDLAACVCGAVAVAICYHSMAEPKWKWLQLGALFCGGVLLVVTVPLLYLWISVPHDALVRSFVEFPKINFAARHIPYPGPGSVMAWIVFYLPLSVIVAAAITFQQDAAARRPTFALLWMASASTLALAIQRLDTVHAYPAIVFSMVLLCACMDLWQRESRRLLRTILLSGATFCYAFVPLIDWSQQVTALRQIGQSQQPKEIVRAGSVRLASDQRRAIGYIQRHSPPDGPLFVGAATHGLAWYNDALFYFLADRPQGTPFDMFVPGITNSAAVQAEIRQDIRQKQIEYVVLFRVPPSKEPNLSSADNGVRIMDDAIRQDYRQVAEFGRYTIWQRKDL